MKGQQLTFVAPKRVALRAVPVGNPESGQVRVRAQVAAISAGTELLVYRGQMPAGLDRDETLPGFEGSFSYPLTYGYATVGQVEAVGADARGIEVGDTVFAFHPHASHFVTDVRNVLRVPAGLGVEQAAFFASMETACNLLLDGAPRQGERVAVVGTGVIGLMVLALLERMPLESVAVVEPVASRRAQAQHLGAQAWAPDDTAPWASVWDGHDADLIYELSGTPQGLDLALAHTAFEGTVVVGSWYGNKAVAVDMGSRFHRRRLRVVSSQVSHVAGALAPRWDRDRRRQWTWTMLETLDVAAWISHRFPFGRAGDAYALLDQTPDACLQVMLRHTS